MNASKAVNGLDKVVEFIQAAKIHNGSKAARMIDEIRNAQTTIEEQDERIAIMQESDSLGGLFLEVLERWAKAEREIIDEFSGSDSEKAEKNLADTLQEYLKRAADCGVATFPVYQFEKGHCRTALHTDENGFVAVWLSTDDYAEPGSQPGITGKEVPVFGLRIRDAEHARHVEKAFRVIADFLENMKGARE